MRGRLQAGVEEAGELELSPAEVELLLELARGAAHESGDRTNAPLAAYLVGVAHARSKTKDLEALVALALGNDTRAPPGASGTTSGDS